MSDGDGGDDGPEGAGPDWRELFGYPEPYDHQAAAIESAIEVGRAGGFSVVEGGCGTGKTLVALTAGIALVRDPTTQFERVFVLTSVKQQLRGFESDLRVVNRNLPDGVDTVRGLSLQGKVELCPYRRAGAAGFTEANCHRRCRRLRAATGAVGRGDEERFAELADAEETAGGAHGRLAVAGTETPYRESLPTRRGTTYCPFYARTKATEEPLVAFDDADGGVLDADGLTRLAGAAGSCPHSAMGELLGDAEVVVANYYHAFDRGTLQLTHPIVDESTFVVCDEAHMLEPRVREIRSTDVGLSTIDAARVELARLVAGRGDRGETASVVDRSSAALAEECGRLVAHRESLDADEVRSLLADAGLDSDHVEYAYAFLTALSAAVEEIVESRVAGEHGAWRADPSRLPDRTTVPLREPETPGPDTVSEWVGRSRFPGRVWADMATICELAADAVGRVESDESALAPVAELCHEWGERDHTDYFRRVEIEPRDDGGDGGDDGDDGDGLRAVRSLSLGIDNCMPREAIAGRLDSFGGGILMSATLEPMEPYLELTGVSDLAGRRPVETDSYYAEFPPENRASLLVPLPKFTYDNRGAPGEDTAVRRRYLRAIAAVCRSPGNVLVCLPSYAEAEWAAAALDRVDAVDRPVLADEPSDDAATERLKSAFFDGGPKVLTTSLRGTLVEGVDYDGDKLAAAVICGLPLPNVSDPGVRAVRAAYSDRYGDETGYQYAMVAPAVRKTRQAIGRVIRTVDDVGLRVVCDRRYAETETFTAAGRYLGPEAEEFDPVDPDDLAERVAAFWRDRSPP